MQPDHPQTLQSQYPTEIVMSTSASMQVEDLQIPT